MDVDELLPRRRPGDPLVELMRQDLDPLSRDELEERITLLEAEIARCRGKLAAAGAFRQVADALFRK
ncbi:DUF1192 domain-containing protein [Sphingosinicellaceae bacterium M-36]